MGHGGVPAGRDPMSRKTDRLLRVRLLASRPCAAAHLVALLAAFLAAASLRAESALPPRESPIVAGEVTVRADSYEQVAPGRLRARGPVELLAGDTRVLADRAEVSDEVQADGSIRKRVVAEGNVVLLRDEDRLSGDRLEMDGSGRGVLTNAVGFLQPDVFVEARRLERVDDDTYRIEDGRFTSCAQPSPRWKFTASSATVDVGRRITARRVVFKVKGVPAFYTPFAYYPLHKDGRSSGFLLPNLETSRSGGFKVGTGFYWAMGRSADQTFVFDRYSKLGQGFGHELRWAARRPSQGTLRSYLFDGRGPDALDYDLDWNALQQLPAGTRATLAVRSYSDRLFEQRLQQDFGRSTGPKLDWSGGLSSELGFASLSAYASGKKTGSDADLSVLERLPGLSLLRSPGRIGLGGIVFGMKASAERLRNDRGPVLRAWSRYDVRPRLSRPLRLGFLRLNPELSYRYTRYGATRIDHEPGEWTLLPRPIDRTFFEASLEMRGPTFVRVFDTPGFGYSERFKHTIGPELTFTHRSSTGNLSAVPIFEGGDSLPGTEEIRYALVQRLFAKRPGRSGKSQPYELLSWTLSQTAYLKASERQNGFDPRYRSSVALIDGRAASRSSLLSEVQLRPSPNTSLDHALEYDVNRGRVVATSLELTLTRTRLSLSGGWSRSLRGTESSRESSGGPSEAGLEAKSDLHGRLDLELLPRRLFAHSSWAYDLAGHELRDLTGGFRYSLQCCGLVVDYVRGLVDGHPDPRWGIRIELAHVGSIGGFLPPGRR